MTRLFRSFAPAIALVAALLTAGCASLPAPEAGKPAQTNPDDPWEGFNRSIFEFNESFDAWVLKPVAKGYDAVTPTPVRVGVTNFFGNIGDVWVGINNLMQGKPRSAASDLGRFVVNSTMGVGGLLDVASPMGLPRHEEDFGQTLAIWGVGSGPYVVLPFLGPSTARDTGGVSVDLAASPIRLINDDVTRYQVNAVRLINARADLLPAESVVNGAALDKYAYWRSAFLQRRRFVIHDGNPPREDDFSGE